MNIYEYAIKMEKDGESYYREQAQKTTNKGLISILNILADSEVKHYKTLEKMRDEDKTATFADTAVLEGAKNIFAEM
ncbi:MAG: rubrerythrin, partial [Calditrichia bacterium]|nr:rubrerythrin [Calditrichia bacterium]